MSSAGIVLDDREESRLAVELSRFDFPVHTLRLESQDSAGRNVSMGDAMFSGSGPSGPVQVGIERKKLDDLIACMKDRRLSRQLKDMREICQYERIYVVIEGLWKPSQSGMMEVMNGGGVWRPQYSSRQSGAGITYEQVDSFLQSVSETGAVVVRTGSLSETAFFYASRYHWWQKPYAQHRSMDGLYSTDPENQRRGKLILHQGTPSPVCQVAAQLPGVDAKAWSIAEQFGSVFEMVTGHPMADWEFKEAVARWMRTTWTDSSGKDKRFGRKTAAEIVNYLRRSK